MLSSSQLIAETALKDRLSSGFSASGAVGGPFSKENPPPGMTFGGYLKGAMGITWRVKTKEVQKEERGGEGEGGGGEGGEGKEVNEGKEREQEEKKYKEGRARGGRGVGEMIHIGGIFNLPGMRKASKELELYMEEWRKQGAFVTIGKKKKWS